MISLRNYQNEAIAAVVDAEARGIRRPLIALPTGTGKTVVFAHLISQRPGRSLVLVHRDELIRQAYGKLKEINPSLSVGIIKAEVDECIPPCVIASVQTLARDSRLQRLTPDFRTIVVDEARKHWDRVNRTIGEGVFAGPQGERAEQLGVRIEE